MPTVVDSGTAREPETVAGRLFSAGPGTAVLSLALPSALPIPLGAAGLDLVAWAFAGLSPEDARGPRALLVLAARDGAAPRGNAVIGIATHYRDLAVSVGAAEPLDALPADDRAVLARALLSCASPATVEALADLAGLIEGAAIVPEADAPEIALSGDAGRLSGSLVPDYLLVRRGPAWACLLVARARLGFGADPYMDLTLAPVWGPPGGSAQAAILLCADRFTPARIGDARGDAR